MRKLYLVIIALVGLMVSSCVQEHIEAQFFPENVTVQGLGSITGIALSEDGPAITTSYSEVDFGLSVPKSYVLWMDLSGNSFANAKKVDATISGGKIEFGQKKFNKLLLNMGIEPDTEVAVDFRLDAYMQNEKLVNIEESVQHSNVVTASFVVYEEIKGDMEVVDVPGDYQGWAPSDYPKLFNYSYDGVIFRGVVDFQCKDESKSAANGFKFTYGGNWDSDSGNWGSADQGEAPEAGSIKLINGDASQNIMCYGAKRYYLFELNKDELTVNKIYSFDKAGIIGLNGDWDNDVVMTYNMFFGRFWADVDIASDTEFKFRLDGAWDNNWGGNLEGLTPGGENIPIAAGQYRIYFYMNDVTVYAELSPDMYGKEEPTVEPDPVPVPAYEGWGIIGVGGDWEKDVAMTQDGDIWTGYANIAAADQWKIRKDAAWDENFGGPGNDEPYVVTLGEVVNGVAGGKNMSVPADGFYKIVFDAANETITVSDATVWGLIGDFNEWGGDTFMTEVDGKWVSPVVELTGGWKIRKNSGWDDNRGGTFAEFDTPFEAVSDGDNIDCGTGKFIVTYDPATETITVANAAKSWGVVGDFCGWGDDVDMFEVMPGVWVSPAIDLTSGGWKVRFDDGWDINRGGATPSAQGELVAAVPDGDNLTLEGTFRVVYNANNETIGTLGFGITGSVASCGLNWDNDIPMNLAADGKYYSIPVALSTADQIKVRWNAGWDINRGGACTAADVEFDAVENGDNITAPADGTYMIVYDPATEKLTLSTLFWGLIGDFNSWGADTFMLPLGEGKWAAYNQTLAGGWKFRQSALWAVNFGGEYAAIGTPFEVRQDGPNITCEEEGIAILLDTVAATATISK